jgi:hypothetical protein
MNSGWGYCGDTSSQKLPYSKPALAHIGVMKQDDAVRPQFWQPRLKVMFDGFVRVMAINVKILIVPSAKEGSASSKVL